jgi:hypothetical protein
MALLFLRWSVAALSLRRFGIDPSLVRMRFVVDKVALWQVFFYDNAGFFPCQYHSTNVPYLSPKLYWGADKSLARPGRKQTSYSDRRFRVSYILFIIITGGISVIFLYITRLASNDIFSRSNKIHWEVGRAKDLSAPLYKLSDWLSHQRATYFSLVSWLNCRFKSRMTR